MYSGMKGKSLELSRHFNLVEFDCTCTTPQCTTTEVSQRLVALLEKLRTVIGDKDIHIKSGYRCAAKQQSLREQGYETSKGKSTHESGEAADIFVKGVTGAELARAAREAGFLAVGVAKTWIHVDTRPTHHAWEYK